MSLGTVWGLSLAEVELPIGLGGVTSYQILTNSECRQTYPAMRARVLRSASERERTQTHG
jgi:hypothetical protein